jgi:hypothetical protein
MLIGTWLATIAIVVATDVSDVAKRQQNPWSSWIKMEDDTMRALCNVLESAAAWNGCPIRCWHTGFALSSILPIEATVSLDRKVPARRI